jgi:hypothetical protein
VANDEAPKGKLFSSVYLLRGEPLLDSDRFRRRFDAYFGLHLDFIVDVNQRSKSFGLLLAEAVHLRLGVDVPSGYSGYSFSRYFRSADVRDVLDTVTLIFHLLNRVRESKRAAEFLAFVGAVLAEENLGYRVDDQGGVHHFVDAEFNRNRVATLRCLEAPRFAAVLAEFESAHRSLDEDPPNTKASIRSAFEADEILVKLLDGGKIARLMPPEAEKVLGPMVQRAYADDDTARDAAKAILRGFFDWVVSVQPYRHGQRLEEFRPPPINLTVAIVSSAATYIRWMIDLERAQSVGTALP